MYMTLKDKKKKSFLWASVSIVPWLPTVSTKSCLLSRLLAVMVAVVVGVTDGKREGGRRVYRRSTRLWASGILQVIRAKFPDLLVQIPLPL